MISFEEAQRRILAECAPGGVQDVPVDAASGRVLAETLVAGGDLVPFARSAMDGFAVRAEDTAYGASLPVRERVYAERSLPLVHEARTATQIATGAPIPAGADAVIPVEDVARNNGTIVLSSAVEVGRHIFPPGEDARAGDVLLPRGRRLQAADVGLVAAAGHARVRVFRKPRAAVLTTGDEVVGPAQQPEHGQIRNSNGAVIAATLDAWGCEVAGVTHSGDDAAVLGAALERWLGACDLLVTTGGASVGDRDLVKGLLGGPFVFDTVALRPAKPTAFVRKGKTCVVVLPGNPSSSFVALHEFVRLAALGLAGADHPTLPHVQATLAGRVHAKSQRTYAAYGTLRLRDGALIATPLDNQCSALTRTASDADGFIVVPPGKRDYDSGDAVDFHVVDWSRVADRET